MKYIKDPSFGNQDYNIPRFIPSDDGNNAWYRNQTIANRKPYEEILDNISDEISDIDDKICNLYMKKMSLTKEAISRANDLSVSKSICGFTTKQIKEEYKKSGFNSNIIKHAIENIRNLFFNDCDYDHQKYSCIRIFSESYDYDRGIKFEFYNGERMFHISIPNNTISKPSEVAKYKTKYFGGTITIGYDKSRYCSTIFCSSYSITELRDAVNRFIKAESTYELDEDWFEKFEGYYNLTDRMENIEKMFDLTGMSDRYDYGYED